MMILSSIPTCDAYICFGYCVNIATLFINVSTMPRLIGFPQTLTFVILVSKADLHISSSIPLLGAVHILPYHAYNIVESTSLATTVMVLLDN
jgi:hypothetical protein